MWQATLVGEQMLRTRNFYVAEIGVNRIVTRYNIPTVHNLNLRPTTEMLIRCNLSELPMLDKCP